MSRMYRFVIAKLSVCIFIGLVTGCRLEDKGIDTGPLTNVSLYHESPDAPDLDILVDDLKINSVPFKYGVNTSYLRFSSGIRNLKFKPFGASTISIDTMLTLEPDEDFSVFVIDEFEKVRVMMLWDHPSLPAAGIAKVRFINLSPDSNPVQLKIKDETTPLTVGLSFTSASPFLDLAAGTHNFQITSGGNVVAELPETQLQSGWFYTIIVRGYVTPPADNTNTLTAQIVVN